METNKEKMKRFLLHIPVGFVFSVLSFLTTLNAIGFLILWIIYELNEDFHIKDQAWKDIPGFMTGLTLGAILCCFYTNM